ncbi:MAG: hypothetical protein ACRDQD_21725 [Nocardioidaceae bacterium]
MAEFRLFEVEEGSVPFGPATRREIVPELVHGPLFGIPPLLRSTPRPAADVLVEVGLGPSRSKGFCSAIA